MPVEFLSVEQGAGFGRFAGELSQSDLDRFFYLDDADRDFVAVRSGDHNRLSSVAWTASTSPSSRKRYCRATLS